MSVNIILSYSVNPKTSCSLDLSSLLPNHFKIVSFQTEAVVQTKVKQIAAIMKSIIET